MGNPAFHRSAFQKTLENHLNLSTTTCHLSKRLVSYKQSRNTDSYEPIVLNFSDGSAATCDVLIGADGIYSVTRQELLRDHAKESLDQAADLLDKADAVWSGTVAYRGIVPVEKLAAVSPNHRALTKPVNVSIS